MDSTNKEEGARFQALMRGLAENFSAEITEDGMLLRYRALSKYTIGQLEDASVRLLRRRVYTTMPTVAEFVLAIEGSSSMKADKQIQSIRNAISGCGRNGSPDFHDPITHYLVHSKFGWTRTCNKSEQEMYFLEKEFVTSYQQYEANPELLKLNGPRDNGGSVILPNVVKKIK